MNFLTPIHDPIHIPIHVAKEISKAGFSLRCPAL